MLEYVKFWVAKYLLDVGFVVCILLVIFGAYFIARFGQWITRKVRKDRYNGKDF